MNSAELRAVARALDAADPLAPLRSKFALPMHIDGRPAIYLCGHSLGLAPLTAQTMLLEELEDWHRLAVLGHHVARRPWIEYASFLRPQLALLAGAAESEVVAMNSLTVNLHLLLTSFYQPRGRRRCIVVEQGAFSSDRHAVLSHVQWHQLDPNDALIEIAPDPNTGLISESALEQLLAERSDEIALVLWPGVQYRTGQAFDLTRVARAARTAGAVCGFDLAHAIGNLPLRLHDDGADFAVWCGYKYLNGGPGAVGGAFVHARHERAALPGLAGWWGHEPATRFRMGPDFSPAHGAAGWQVSNPPVFSSTPLLASLQVFAAADLNQLRAKSLQMTQLLLDQFDARLNPFLQCITPREAAGHGCQLSLRVRAGRNAGHLVYEDLGASGVVADWREPDILRIAPVPLYNRFEDLADFCDVLEAALRRHA